MQLIWSKLIVLFVFFFEGLFFGIVPLITLKRFSIENQQHILGISNSFAGGIFLCSGFVHLLAESLETLNHEVNVEYPIGLLLSALGFLFTFFIENLFFDHQHNQNETEPLLKKETEPLLKKETNKSTNTQNQTSIGSLLFIIVLSVHSFISGVTVGIQSDSNSFISIVVAIGVHKWIEAFAIGVTLIRMGEIGSKLIMKVAIYSSMEPIGIVIGEILNLTITGDSLMIVEALITAFASGTFIYVASIDILAEEFTRKTNKFQKTASCIIGFSLMSILATLFSHEQHE